MSEFRLPQNQPFIIAEIANAHSGSVKNLEQLVDYIIKIKPDAVKFQLFKTSELLVKNHKDFDLYERLEIRDDIWHKIFKKLKDAHDIRIFADVFSVNRAKFATKLNIDAFKIHSSDINNYNLLQYVASIKKPILLSCSGCTSQEIDNAVSTIKKINNLQIILMHGFQGFPTKLSQINLQRILALKKRYDLPVGYMDHIAGDSALALHLPLLAIGLGANIIEKHITLDRSKKDEDYQSSLNPGEFIKMMNILKKSYQSLGHKSLKITGDELHYRQNMKKKWVSKRELRKDYEIKVNDVALKRTNAHVTEISHDTLIGGRTKSLIKKEEPFSQRNVLPKTKISSVIACRIDSTRLFAKPLQLIGNKTILEHIISQLKQSKLLGEIVLAISEKPGNEIFVDFARKNNIKFVVGDDYDVLQRIILAGEHVNSDIILRVTSEDPYKYWQAIDSAIKHHVSSKVDYTSCIENLPQGSGFELVNLSALKISHKKGNKRNRSELVTSYIDEHKNKFKINTIKIEKNLQRPDIRLTVDYPEDLVLCREILTKLLMNNKLPDLTKIIQLIDTDPNINKIHNMAVMRANKGN